MQVIFVNVTILFLLLFVGYYMGVSKMVAHSSINDITNILIEISIPCTIVVSMIRPFSEELMHDAGLVVLIAAIYHLVIAFISYIVTKMLKVDEKKQGSWIFAMVFSNNGFIGYPLMYALYGNNGLFIMAIANIVQNVFIFSLGIKLTTMNYHLKERIHIKDIVITRQNAAVVIGMLLFIFQVHVPKPALTFLTYIANLTVPLSMMVVGLSLSRYDVKKMFTDFETYRLTVFRMIIIPVIMLAGYKLLHIDANKSLPFAILFYTAVLPSPAFTTIMAERYRTNIEFSSKCVFITTIVSVVSVPILAGML